MEIRLINGQEIEPVCDLVMRCFNTFIAPGYSQEGCDEFASFATPVAMRRRISETSFVLAAVNEGKIAGMVEVRCPYHIALFDVEPDCHCQGIGRQLMKATVDHCRELHPDLDKITVNAAPGAVVVYQHLGFSATATEQETHGIRYVPMELLLKLR